ncbi:WD repeat-containing protein 97 [Kryptolebias marmoratus]|uniref:WD repeat-containing protein 97 n=1 Tax=Kryptolebias marmoratus TaxID=37003 RepID=UPI0018AC9E99|nr:WD repeat-containing protein 97 [Kryptolebias marmoratus]
MTAVAPGEMSTTVLFPSPTPGLLSHHTERSNERTLKMQGLFRLDEERSQRKIVISRRKRWHPLGHYLHHLHYFSTDSPVRFMMYSEAAAAFISLHSDNTVCLYKGVDHKQTLMTELPFLGLTATKIPGCLVGWGPGPVCKLLDSELRLVKAAADALDIHVCKPAEHSWDLVTAGVGNVCVWSVVLMRCKVKIQDGLQKHGTITCLTLAPPRPDRPHRAFVASGMVVTVVDLDEGRILDHMIKVCSSNITAMEYCDQLDCLIIANQKLSIKVWGPDWALRVTFKGHDDVVNSLFFCSKLNMLISSSADCTIRTWNLEECVAVECVQTKQENSQLHIGGTKEGDIFFSFSNTGVDFWTIRTVYNLHCKLSEDKGAPLRQIQVSNFSPPYPTRLLCLSSDSHISLLAAETGAILTSFKANDRILCADYCLHEEILLALTEAGTVLQVNTLTNPMTLMQEWKDRGQGPWNRAECYHPQYQTAPGPACCLVIYSCLADKQRALEDWRRLQEGRGSSHRNNRELSDAKNKFLVIIGQNGGCVSVLTIDNGKILLRTPAHMGLKVTALQAYPENSYLLSTGEDLTVVVWSVYPDSERCLIQHLTVVCNQPQVYLAALRSQLAMTFQEPNSGSYILKLSSLLNQEEADYLPGERHSDHFTGLCAIPELNVFVSVSLDKTVRIWNEENRLIRRVELEDVPQCLAYSGHAGELFLGVRGDLYRLRCAQFLPKDYRERLCLTYEAEPLPDLPIPETKETYKLTKASKDQAKKLQAVINNQLMSGDVLQDKDKLEILNMDLKALVEGAVKRKKEKFPSTLQTRKEAFGHYMNKIYGFSTIKKVNLDDIFDPDEFSFNNEMKYIGPRFLPKLQKDVRPQPKQDIPVEVKKEKQLKQQKKKTTPVAVVKVTPQPPEKVKPKKPPRMKKTVQVEKTEKPQEIIVLIEQPKPKTPGPRIPSPLPQREPSSEVPTFLKQFADIKWFNDIYPVKKSIPSNLSPEEFALQLLKYLQTCSSTMKIKILAAIRALHSQGLLHDTSKLYTGLINSLHQFIRPQMTPLNCTVIVDALNLLVRLQSKISYDLVKILLTLLAFKQLDLQKPILLLLGALGVNEAEQWLWPELESWDSELQDQTNTWETLHDRADCWIESWISKFKEHNRYLYLTSTEKWKPPTFSAVDVLNYFCFVQREEHFKITRGVPGRKNTVLLPLHDWHVKIIVM